MMRILLTCLLALGCIIVPALTIAYLSVDICQRQQITALNAQRLELGRAFDLALRWQLDRHQAELARQEFEHKQELGAKRRQWLEKVYAMHYRDCYLSIRDITRCNQSARAGYVSGAHDDTPAPGFDWPYIEFGTRPDSS